MGLSDRIKSNNGNGAAPTVELPSNQGGRHGEQVACLLAQTVRPPSGPASW